MAAKVKVPSKAKIKQLVNETAGRLLRKIGPTIGHARFVRIKKFIISEVERHRVCRELKSHTNNSDFVPGTLFGFLGFEAGSDPVGDLLSYLEGNIEENNVFISGVLLNITRVRLPSFSQMGNEASLQLPWQSGLSWPEAIESGVSGLPYFLRYPDGEGYVPDNSRSQEGLQSKNRVRADDMTPVPFLTPIFIAASQII